MNINILFYIIGFFTIILFFVSFSETYIYIRKKYNPDYKSFSIRNFYWKILRYMSIIELQRLKGYTKEESIKIVDQVGQDWKKDMMGINKNIKKGINNTTRYIGGKKINKFVYYIPFFGYLIAIMLYQDKLIKKPLFLLYFMVSMVILAGCVALMIINFQ